MPQAGLEGERREPDPQTAQPLALEPTDNNLVDDGHAAQASRALALEFRLPAVLHATFPDLFNAPPQLSLNSAQGRVNLTFKVECEQGPFIVRGEIAEHDVSAGMMHHFVKESFLFERARSVPGLRELVPSVARTALTEIGRISIQTCLPGISGADPRFGRNTEDVALHADLGKCCALINQIPVSGYGQRILWATHSFEYASGVELLSAELQKVDWAVLAARFSPSQIADLQERTRESLTVFKDREPILLVTDLTAVNAGNCLRAPEGGRITGLIDWEAGMACPGKEFQIARALVHHLAASSLNWDNPTVNAFLTAYGMSESEFTPEFKRNVETAWLLSALAQEAMLINAIEGRPSVDRPPIDKGIWKPWLEFLERGVNGVLASH